MCIRDSLSKQYVRDHLQSTSGFKGISSDIQNELVEFVTDIIQEKIKVELDSCDFIGIQADETLDISSRSQVSIIFRFCSKEGLSDFVQYKGSLCFMMFQ